MNDKVFNESVAPLFTQAVNTYAIPTVTGIQEESAANSGVLYFLTTGSQSVVASGFLVVQLSNPALSARTINISRVGGGVLPIQELILCGMLHSLPLERL